MELGKQHPRSTVRERTIRLMDDFSQGLSVRTIHNVFACEFESVSNGLQPNRLDAYSQFVDAYMESNLKLEVPGTYPENLSGLAANMVFGYMSEMSIAQFMNQWLEDSLSPATSTIQQGFMEKAIEEHDWRSKNQVPLKEIEEAEFAAMVQTLLPQIWSVLRAADPRLIQKMQGEEIQILECCPTFWCGYKLMAALRSNQPVKGNDIWDFLHVASAAPYVDCLACDKGTRHICSNLLGMDSKYGTCILSSEKDLTKWVLDL